VVDYFGGPKRKLCQIKMINLAMTIESKIN
jgi:hypothetical protein